MRHLRTICGLGLTLLLTSGCAAWFRLPADPLDQVAGPQKALWQSPAALGANVNATITVIPTWDGATLDFTTTGNTSDLQNQVARLAHDIRYGQRLGILIGPDLLETRLRVEAIAGGVRLRLAVDDPDIAPILQRRVLELTRHLQVERRRSFPSPTGEVIGV